MNTTKKMSHEEAEVVADERATSELAEFLYEATDGEYTRAYERRVEQYLEEMYAAGLVEGH